MRLSVNRKFVDRLLELRPPGESSVRDVVLRLGTPRPMFLRYSFDHAQSEYLSQPARRPFPRRELSKLEAERKGVSRLVAEGWAFPSFSGTAIRECFGSAEEYRRNASGN